jgi:DNA repair exonuclease SbcCD ATPase subunit
VFLLGETPSRRSAVLSIGQEAGYIRDMLVIHRERCRRDNDVVRNGERELIGLSETLEGLKELDTLKEQLSAARDQAEYVKAAATRLERLQGHAYKLVDIGRRLRVAQARADIAAQLPEAERLASLTRAVERSRERERLGQRVLQLSRSLALGKARLGVMQGMPGAAPTLENTLSAQNILKRLSDLRSAAHIARSRMAQVDEGMKSLQDEMARLVEETGGLCPTCGSPVKPENLLDHHTHSSHSATPSERLTA